MLLDFLVRHTCVRAYMYVCVDTHAHTHTHTHTHTHQHSHEYAMHIQTDHLIVLYNAHRLEGHEAAARKITTRIIHSIVTMNV